MRKWKITNIIDIYLNQNPKLQILQFEKFKKNWKREQTFHFIWNVELSNWDLEKFIQRDQEENRFHKFQTSLVSAVQLFTKSLKIIWTMMETFCILKNMKEPEWLSLKLLSMVKRKVWFQYWKILKHWENGLIYHWMQDVQF